MESAEGAIIDARRELPKVFAKGLAAFDKKAPKRPKLDDGDDFQERSTAFRQNSMSVVCNPVFFILVMVSKFSMGPIDKFFLWSQKRVKLHNRRLQEHKDADRVYLGPTPLSDIMLTQDGLTLDAMDSLLLASWTSTPWDVISSYIDEHFQEDAVKKSITSETMCFIVTQVLTVKASWQFRFSERYAFWKQICQMVVKDPGELCDVRKGIAIVWSTSPECCLTSAVTDVPFKLSKLFASELQVVCADGRVPLKLFELLVLIRAQLPMDVQEVEGMNSILQMMGKRAPNMNVTLASDRMQLKKGTPIFFLRHTYSSGHKFSGKSDLMKRLVAYDMIHNLTCGINC